MTPDEIIKQCDSNIKVMGASAKVHLVLPGRATPTHRKVLCRGGPVGIIHAEMADDKRLLVVFSAAEVKTYLEEARQSNATNRC